MTENILKTVHNVRHTYRSGDSFTDWFFSIVKQKIKGALSKNGGKLPKELKQSAHMVSEAHLAHLTIYQIDQHKQERKG